MAGVFKGKDSKKTDPKSPNLPPKAGSSLGLRSHSTSNNPQATVQPVPIPSGVVGTFTSHGTDLAALLAFDQKTVPSAKVPIIISKCCNRLFEMGLSTEGIFRVPGNTNRLTKCENEFNLGNGSSVDFKKMGITVEDAASLLKKFLRESLNDTLFPSSMASEFDSLKQLEGESKNVAFLKLWDRLPAINRAVLSEVLELLMNVAANSFLNLMNVDNLGTVFGGMADIPLRGGKWMMVYLLEEYENLFGTPALKQATAPVIRRKLINHTRSIFCLGYINDKYVISCDGLGAVNVWDAASFALIKKMTSEMKCYVPQLFVKVDSAQIHQLWTMFPDMIRIWDISTILNPGMKKFEDAPSHSINIANACACAQVGETMWIAGEKVQVVDAVTHAVLKEIPEYTMATAGATPVHVLGYAAGYIWIWHGKVLHVWHPESIQKVREITIEGFNSPKTCKIFASDGYVWLSTDTGSFLIVDVERFEIKQVVTGHSAAVYHIQNVGNLAWSCSWDTTICWWKTSPTVELVYKMPNRHSDAVSYLLPVWREHLNGWDVWSASWDRSCQVTFVPATYAQQLSLLPASGPAMLADSSSSSSLNATPTYGTPNSMSPSHSASSIGIPSHATSAPLASTGGMSTPPTAQLPQLPPAIAIPTPTASNPGFGLGVQRPGSPTGGYGAGGPSGSTSPLPAPIGGAPWGARPSPPTGLPAPLPLGSQVNSAINNVNANSANASNFGLPAPTVMLPPPPTTQPPQRSPKSPRKHQQQSIQFEPLTLAQMEQQLKELEAKLSATVLANDRELDTRMSHWSNPPSPSSAQELKNFIKASNEAETEIQLKMEELRLRIRGELHAARYALIYSRLGTR